MSVSIAGIFAQSVFSGGSVPRTDQKAAAAGFSAIFTSMLARQMREAMVGQDNGPMGISGGTSGEIYGSLLDQALGKALAGSKAMAPLNQMIERELGGRQPSPTAAPQVLANATPLTRTNYPGSGAGVARAATAVSPSYTGVTLTNDANGPLLLPPAATGAASNLLPPTPEG